MLFGRKPAAIPTAEEALPGRNEEMPLSNRHHVNGNTLKAPYPEGLEVAYFGMGCFWGAERRFWERDGVFTSAVGYAGGHTLNATYREVCSGMTGHTEAVLVVYDPNTISYRDLLTLFFEAHDPTQGMAQGNDHGSQYRSAIYTTSDQQLEEARIAMDSYQEKLTQQGFGQITTELKPIDNFFFAEEDHQQYLAKNPGGYCGLKGTGVSCR
ncbi:MAG: peptide-methionine (S)-S-oxide reductase MsrA [Acidiferrobacterales bacterium]|nr:peptide-methionine (S)-S-oxide reductase MsrA [Acidiferrobacterales bacterium]